MRNTVRDPAPRSAREWMMARSRITRWLGITLLPVLLACYGPENGRVRGGRGADPGNHGRIIEMHGGAQIYFRTPCRTTLDECTGPIPVSGLPTTRARG
jgi:hypothetical protein